MYGNSKEDFEKFVGFGAEASVDVSKFDKQANMCESIDDTGDIFSSMRSSLNGNTNLFERSGLRVNGRHKIKEAISGGKLKRVIAIKKSLKESEEIKTVEDSSEFSFLGSAGNESYYIKMNKDENGYVLDYQVVDPIGVVVIEEEFEKAMDEDDAYAPSDVLSTIIFDKLGLDEVGVPALEDAEVFTTNANDLVDGPRSNEEKEDDVEIVDADTGESNADQDIEAETSDSGEDEPAEDLGGANEEEVIEDSVEKEEELEESATTAPFVVKVEGVGNLEVPSLEDAKDTFAEYVKRSTDGKGKEVGASVYLMVDGKEVKKHVGTKVNESEGPAGTLKNVTINGKEYDYVNIDTERLTGDGKEDLAGYVDSGDIYLVGEAMGNSGRYELILGEFDEGSAVDKYIDREGRELSDEDYQDELSAIGQIEQVTSLENVSVTGLNESKSTRSKKLIESLKRLKESNGAMPKDENPNKSSKEFKGASTPSASDKTPGAKTDDNKNKKNAPTGASTPSATDKTVPNKKDDNPNSGNMPTGAKVPGPKGDKPSGGAVTKTTLSKKTGANGGFDKPQSFVDFIKTKSGNMNESNMSESSDLDLDKVVEGYLEAAVWASEDEDNEDWGDLSISSPSRDKAKVDVAKFLREAGDLVAGADEGQIGHDFFLTRNGHGAGFWDADRPYAEEAKDKLTELAGKFGAVEVFAQDGGIEISGGKDVSTVNESNQDGTGPKNGIGRGLGPCGKGGKGGLKESSESYDRVESYDGLDVELSQASYGEWAAEPRTKFMDFHKNPPVEGYVEILDYKEGANDSIIVTDIQIHSKGTEDFSRDELLNDVTSIMEDAPEHHFLFESKKVNEADIYKSDEDIAADYAEFKVTNIDVKPSGNSGWINIEFPNMKEEGEEEGSEVSTGWIRYDSGKVAFDDWFPEEVYLGLAKEIGTKIGKSVNESKKIKEANIGEVDEPNKFMDSVKKLSESEDAPTAIATLEEAWSKDKSQDNLKEVWEVLKDSPEEGAKLSEECQVAIKEMLVDDSDAGIEAVAGEGEVIEESEGISLADIKKLDGQEVSPSQFKAIRQHPETKRVSMQGKLNDRGNAENLVVFNDSSSIIVFPGEEEVIEESNCNEAKNTPHVGEVSVVIEKALKDYANEEKPELMAAEKVLELFGYTFDELGDLQPPINEAKKDDPNKESKTEEPSGGEFTKAPAEEDQGKKIDDQDAEKKGKWVITQDGEEKGRADSEEDAQNLVLDFQPKSLHAAFKYDGWAVEEKK